MNGRWCECVSYISARVCVCAALANEQPGVLCNDPQISLQERTVTLIKKLSSCDAKKAAQECFSLKLDSAMHVHVF